MEALFGCVAHGTLGGYDGYLRAKRSHGVNFRRQKAHARVLLIKYTNLAPKTKLGTYQIIGD